MSQRFPLLLMLNGDASLGPPCGRLSKKRNEVHYTEKNHDGEDC